MCSVVVCEVLCSCLINLFDSGGFSVWGNISCIENGLLVGYLIQFCVFGEDFVMLCQIVSQVVDILCKNVEILNVNFDWSEFFKVVEIEIDQDKVCLFGVFSQDLVVLFNMFLNGYIVISYCEGEKSIDVVLCGDCEECMYFVFLFDLVVLMCSGKSVLLSQIGCFKYGFEFGLIWCCDCLFMIIVCGNFYGKIQLVIIVNCVILEIVMFQVSLFVGYCIVIGGFVEELLKGLIFVMVGILIFLLVVIIILMIQLQSIF